MKKILVILLLILATSLFAQSPFRGKVSTFDKYVGQQIGDSTAQHVWILNTSIPVSVSGVTLSADTLLSKVAPYTTVTDTVITISTTAVQFPNISCAYFTVSNLTTGSILKYDRSSGVTSTTDTETVLYLDKVGEYVDNPNKYYGVANASTKVLIKVYNY